MHNILRVKAFSALYFRLPRTLSTGIFLPYRFSHIIGKRRIGFARYPHGVHPGMKYKVLSPTFLFWVFNR